MNRCILITLFLLAFNLITSGQSTTENAISYFEKFTQVTDGWCASDATISLLLPDGKTLWLFGDTFIGQKTGDFSMNVSGSTFINNSAIMDDGESMTSIFGGTLSNPTSLIPGIGPDIFWPEHATIENDTLKIFAIQIIYVDNGTPRFNFRTGRTFLAKFTYPQLDFISNNPIEFITDTTMRFGVQVLKRDDYTYIFGVKDTTAGGFTYPIPILARVDSSVDEPWKFYSENNKWSLNCDAAVSIGDRPMPESFYVYEKDHKFYLIMHEIWTVGELYILEADSITGPWNRATSGGIEKLFAVIKPKTSIITYNLFAHPQFENNDKLLISFNVNTSNFSSIYSDTRNYRARFLWLSIDNAMNVQVPDTIDLDEAAMVISETGKCTEQITTCNGQLSIKNMTSGYDLRIYTVNGKLVYQKVFQTDAQLNLNNLPNTLLLIQLQTKNSILTKKIINL